MTTTYSAQLGYGDGKTTSITTPNTKVGWNSEDADDKKQAYAFGTAAAALLESGTFKAFTHAEKYGAEELAS